MHWAKSLPELESLGFLYDEAREILSCSLFKNTDYGEFEYQKIEGLSFAEEKMSKKFMNLKESVKRHICNSKSHSSILEDKEAAEVKLVSKNHEVGMN